MIRKVDFRDAAIAGLDEIENLADYVKQNAARKEFSKPAGSHPYQFNPTTRKEQSGQPSPYHYLRTDLSLLLGPSGSKLLNGTWTKYKLHPGERDANLLRPALMKLFSVAARIAAPRGVGQALKRLVGDFERRYFSIVVDPVVAAEAHSERRFALLSVLQNGQGCHLLHGILGNSKTEFHCDATPPESFPSRHIEQDPALARRLFLFEAAYRAKSWSEAYRQARMLNQTARVKKFGVKLTEICQGLKPPNCPKSKKKQILTDLARCSKEKQNRRIDLALEAISSPTLGCRPGELEELLCQLLPSGDPWWRSSLNRLYRHQAVPHRWATDLRKLWQSDPSLRGFCRVIFNILRYPRDRAAASLERHGLAYLGTNEDWTQVRARISKVRTEVLKWQGLLATDEPTNKTDAERQAIEPDHWEHLKKLCALLECPLPNGSFKRSQSQAALISQTDTGPTLYLNESFLHSPPNDQRFLLARAVFRFLAGLDNLAEQARATIGVAPLLERALAYADWNAHAPQLLLETRKGPAGAEELLTILEEMYWENQDPIYRKLALFAHQKSWCPLFDREADLFAARYTNIVSASYGLLKADPAGNTVPWDHENTGLEAALTLLNNCPAACLRLQSLWIDAADRLQATR